MASFDALWFPGICLRWPRSSATIFLFLRHLLVRHRLPVCRLRVLFVVEWTATSHDWNFQEIVSFRRGFGIPFQSKGIPGICTGFFTTTKSDNEVPDEYEDG